MNDIQGRIIKGIGGLYFVDTDDGVYQCAARGIFRKDKQTLLIGDFVRLEILRDENGLKGSICEILDRKNELLRPRVSNVDLAVIVFSITHPRINPDLLDRFIILAEEQNVEIVLCINKIDLAEKSELNNITELYGRLYNVLPVSAKHGLGFDKLREIIDKKVTVLAGPSGVGKSSIINQLLPGASLKTGKLSQKIERGKHTTRQVELLNIRDDTFIIDSPGFTSLNLDNISEDELQNYFKEFRDFTDGCKFVNCVHIHEPDCAVKDNVGGRVSEQRYKRYCDLFEAIRQRR